MFTLKLRSIATLGIIAAMGIAFWSVLTPSIETASAAASDYFLKLDGVAGEISIESFSWGVSATRDKATGQASGRRQYEPIIIRKRIDKASPMLLRMATDGTHMKTAVLVGQTADGQRFEVSFFDVFVDLYRQSGDAGSPPMESVSFTYQKIEMK